MAKKKRNWISKNEFDFNKINKFKSKKKSMTIVGEAYTIRDLVQRMASGTMPAVNMNDSFIEDMDHDDYDYEEIHNMDLAEIQELQIEIGERLQVLQDEVKEKDEPKVRKDANASTEKSSPKEPKAEPAEPSKPEGEDE